jgi:hypothetical protein
MKPQPSPPSDANEKNEKSNDLLEQFRAYHINLKGGNACHAGKDDFHVTGVRLRAVVSAQSGRLGVVS